MADTLSVEGGRLPRSEAAGGASTLDRLSTFRVTYLAIFGFLLLSVLSIQLAEVLLYQYFSSSVAQAIRVRPADGPIAEQIQLRVGELVSDSVWTRWGGVRVNAFVLGADGRSLYVGGRVVPPPPMAGAESPLLASRRLLPATSEVVVSVPLDSLLAGGILVAYAAVMLQGLFIYSRAMARREEERMAAAVAARDGAAERAGSIERELDGVRERLRAIEPAERAHGEEIRGLQRERESLQKKLSDLAAREAELRAEASRSTDLEQERQALEELLEEALEDVSQKEGEIQSLQERLKRAAKAAPSGGRGRAAEQLAKRMRTLYKNLEFDDRAISDLVALRDETMKLKAEEALKRLADDPETAAVRRKVGGLPPQLSIFELGFAGKGRIYYARGRQRHYRVLAVGAKNTQKPDLEYLSRLSDV